MVDTEFNEQGNIIQQKVFTENKVEPQQVIHFYYLDQGKEKTSIATNSLEKNATIIFMTTLEKDHYGSWIKQKEERSDGTILFTLEKLNI